MGNDSQLFNNFLASLKSQLNRNSGYSARLEIQKILDDIADSPRRLEHYGFKVYSQNDEDGIIEEIFNRLNISNGLFCEIGVENGLECNTLYLLHKGWRGFWIEGNENQRPFIESKFESVLENKKLVLAIGMMQPEIINSVISSQLAPILSIESDDIDFLSIDIDGMDIYLFEALNFKPKVICIEYNAKFPPNISKKPIYNQAYNWSGTDYMGSSLLALKQTGDIKGYTLVATNITGANAFFVRDDLVRADFDSLNIHDLYNPPRYYLLFDHFIKIGHSADFGLYTDLV